MNFGVIEIEAINPPALGVVGVLEGVHQQEQREQALFVNSGSQQRSDVGERGARAFATDGAQRGNAHADEDISFGVFARTGLEESLQHGDPVRFGGGAETRP